MVVRKILPYTGLMLLAALVLLPTPLMAQEQNDAYIKDHCTEAQTSLKQFQKSELVSRYVRGRSYELLLRQMTALNTRFVTNKDSVPELTQATTDLSATIDRFRDNYDRTYDKTLLSAIRLDCKEKPGEFYSLIKKAQQERATVAVEISQADRYIAVYREALVKVDEALKAKIPQPGGTN